MKLMEGKKGIIFGVSIKRGIAYSIAKAIYDQGGEIAFTYANEAMKSRVTPLAEEMGAKIITECDVTNEDHIKATFEKFKEVYGKLDFVIHAVAYANKEDISGNFYETSRAGWDLALGVSAYSLIPISRYAMPLMSEGGAITTLTYLGSVMSVANYNVMGVAKAALESTTRYLALELGEHGIRVNALSAGPLKTLAAKGIAGFDTMLKANKLRAPLRRNVTLEDVAGAGLYLSSDLSSGVTGEVHYVDCGFNTVGISKAECEVVLSAGK